MVGERLATSEATVAQSTMTLVVDGKPLKLDAAALKKAYPHATEHAVLLVHGAKATEAEWHPAKGRDGGKDIGKDFGAQLQRDCRLTPLYLRYDSNRPVPENGRTLSRLLERLAETYPVALEGLVLLGHGAGGLLLRSATREAALSSARWLRRVRRVVYLDYPQPGALLERLDTLVAEATEQTESTETRVRARVASLSEDGLQLGEPTGPGLRRSALTQADRALVDVRHPVPLLPAVQHFLIATGPPKPSVAPYFGELNPSLHGPPGRCHFPPSHLRLFPKLAPSGLLQSAEVYGVLREWCAD